MYTDFKSRTPCTITLTRLSLGMCLKDLLILSHDITRSRVGGRLQKVFCDLVVFEVLGGILGRLLITGGARFVVRRPQIKGADYLPLNDYSFPRRRNIDQRRSVECDRRI